MPPFVTQTRNLKPYKKAKLGAHQGAYYVRLSVYDRPGAMAAIAKRMGDREVSIESIVQRRPRSALPGIGARLKPGAPALVVMITHETTEEAIRQAVGAIEKDGKVSERPQVIRIEKLNSDAAGAEGQS
jgi:homoserine dehydrogenase